MRNDKYAQQVRIDLGKSQFNGSRAVFLNSQSSLDNLCLRYSQWRHMISVSPAPFFFGAGYDFEVHAARVGQVNRIF